MEYSTNLYFPEIAGVPFPWGNRSSDVAIIQRCVLPKTRGFVTPLDTGFDSWKKPWSPRWKKRRISLVIQGRYRSRVFLKIAAA